MTDHDALLRAICEHPDDDTPRLIFADFLEENGDSDRAAFVRAQVELARTPAWEPFAVLCRHRRTEWFDGSPWWHTLPPLARLGVGWAPVPFRRGFGWRVEAASPPEWAAVAPRVCRQAPVGELHLNTSAMTLDNLRQFASGEWVRLLRVVHLDGASPVEPTRVLCETPAAAGITDIHFHRSSSPGLPELIGDLMQTPLGRAVRGLHFYVGYEALDELLEALSAGGDATRLERLTFATMGVTSEWIGRLLKSPAGRHLTSLDLPNNYLGLWVLGLPLPPGLRSVGLSNTPSGGVEALSGSDRSPTLRRLDLSRSPLDPQAMRALSRSPRLAGLRSLDVRRCRLRAAELYYLAHATFWPNLVELDLRENPLTDGSVRHLLDVTTPADLTALLLDSRGLSESARAALRRHYGERLVMSGAEPEELRGGTA
jgi:uncharacterized protein (TIGR02996 family)